ncbi:lipopolysaccharide biosynthesis protein [Neolewinella agarilytica]|uniref:Membrane protein involved in the export of O-antigen and teichoic acid n=1 Tax=Neolewinella agarilytica TaxID=478744 RepID=A0A1H9GRY2_9BACT|nr:hypothetical protein [Neolewinella agarilytica]SEQ52847.1 Membrane protein involved in the export of O-antigen and teichoic acid [Neolewinella agarilytica]
MSLRKLGSETMIYGLSNVLGKLLNFVLVTYFISRLMSREEFGVVADLMFWTGWLIALLVFRMDTALFRFASRGDYHPGAVFSRLDGLVQRIGLAFLLLGMVFSKPISTWLGYENQVPYVLLVMLTIFLDVVVAVPLARLRQFERAWFFVAVNLGNVIVNIFFVFLLLYLLPKYPQLIENYTPWTYRPGHEVGYYLAAVCIASLARFLALTIDTYVTFTRPAEEKLPMDFPAILPENVNKVPSWKTIFSYTAPLTLVAVAGIYNAQSGPTMLKELAGTGSMIDNLTYSGLFSAAMKIAIILNLFITAYNYAAEPFFFKQTGKDLATADRTIYADACRAYGLIATLASAGILLFLPWLSLIVPVEYHSGLVILPVLLCANLLFGLYANFSIAYKLTDRTWLGGGIALIGSIIIYFINARYAAELTIWAPAWGMLACYAVMCILAWFVSRKYFPVDYPLLRIGLYLLLALGATMLAARLEGADNWTIAGADAGAKWYIRGAVFTLLLAAFGALEHKWVRRTFF